VHDLSTAAELLHGDEEVVYGDAGYQGIAKRPRADSKSVTGFLAGAVSMG
jgi:IS5 family transposase